MRLPRELEGLPPINGGAAMAAFGRASGQAVRDFMAANFGRELRDDEVDGLWEELKPRYSDAMAACQVVVQRLIDGRVPPASAEGRAGWDEMLAIVRSAAMRGCEAYFKKGAN